MELDNISKRIDGSKLDDALKDKIAGNIDDLTDDELKYLNDNLSDFDELQKLVSADKVDADAVNAWKQKIKEKTKAGKAFNDMLNALKNNKSLKEHIFKGDYRKVTGCHYSAGGDGVNVRFVNNAIP